MSIKKIIGVLLIIYAVLQSTPLFISNIIIYVLIYLGCLTILVKYYGLKININYFTIFSFVWLLYGGISYIWSVDKFLWFRSNVILLIIFTSILIFYYLIDSKEMILYFSRIWFWVLVVVQIIGWFEILTSRYYFTTGDIDPGIQMNWPLVTFLNTNDFSTYITLSLPIALLWIKDEKRIGLKSSLLLSLSTFLLLYQADSRANLFALILGLSAYVFIGRVHLLSKKSVIAVGLAFVAIPFLIFFDFPERIFIFVNANLQEDTLRISLLKNGLALLRESYFVGVGAGNSQYWLQVYQKYNSYRMKWIHNWWAEILVDFGVVIFIGYVLFYLKAVYMNLKNYIETQDYIPLYLFICLLIFALASMSPSTIILMKWLPLYTGYIVASTVYLSENSR